ncbi:MAG: hypothetical protein ABF450_09685, partial [Acetobacter orientalis]
MRGITRKLHHWKSGSLILSIAITGTAWADKQKTLAATPLLPVVPVPVLPLPDKAALVKGALYHPDWNLFNAGNNGASGFGVVNGYGQARWAEDWSALKRAPHAVQNNDWFNCLKYVRLNQSGSIWMSF